MWNTCIYCGEEFEAATAQKKICAECYTELYKAPQKPKKNPNSKLMEDVREATKHNLSYGQWKGRQS